MVEAISFYAQMINEGFSVYLSGTRREAATLDLSEHLSCERHDEGSTYQGKKDESGGEDRSGRQIV